MSDLQCAATVIATAPAAGEAEARGLAESLRYRGIATVYCGASVAAGQTAEIAAAVLNASVQVRSELGDGRDSDRVPDGPDRDSRESAAERACAELRAIADLHRGETVLVVGDRGVLGTAVGRLTGAKVSEPEATGSGGEPFVLEADADGWVVRS